MTNPTTPPHPTAPARGDGEHSYRSYSFRGSWPSYRCVYCGCDSGSIESNKPCPGEQESQAAVAARLRRELAERLAAKDDAALIAHVRDPYFSSTPFTDALAERVERLMGEAHSAREEAARLGREKVDDSDTIRELREQVDRLARESAALAETLLQRTLELDAARAALSMCPDYCVSRKYLARHAPLLSPEPLTPETPHGH